MEIYAPLADRMGMNRIRDELRRFIFFSIKSTGERFNYRKAKFYKK